MEVVPGQRFTRFTARELKFCITPFLSPFPAPNSTIRIKMPHDTERPVRVVRSLFFLSVPHISCNWSVISFLFARAVTEHGCHYFRGFRTRSSHLSGELRVALTLRRRARA